MKFIVKPERVNDAFIVQGMLPDVRFYCVGAESSRADRNAAAPPQTHTCFIYRTTSTAATFLTTVKIQSHVHFQKVLLL